MKPNLEFSKFGATLSHLQESHGVEVKSNLEFSKFGSKITTLSRLHAGIEAPNLTQIKFGATTNSKVVPIRPLEQLEDFI